MKSYGRPGPGLARHRKNASRVGHILTDRCDARRVSHITCGRQAKGAICPLVFAYEGDRRRGVRAANPAGPICGTSIDAVVT